jgi:hypothetical protein
MPGYWSSCGNRSYAQFGIVKPNRAVFPLLALTGYARAADRTRSLAEGFPAYVPKHVGPENLTAAIAAMTGESRDTASGHRPIGGYSGAKMKRGNYWRGLVLAKLTSRRSSRSQVVLDTKCWQSPFYSVRRHEQLLPVAPTPLLGGSTERVWAWWHPSYAELVSRGTPRLSLRPDIFRRFNELVYW